MLFLWPIRGQLFQPEEDRTMFEFITSFYFWLGVVVGGVGGAFIGLGLARRSTTANAYYDKIRKELDEAREQLREYRAKQKNVDKL
jgi:hypothetical protein